MAFPTTVDTRTVRVGAARTSQWAGLDATVTLTPEFTSAVDTTTGDLVVATPIRLDLSEANAWTAAVDVLASDTRGLSLSGFTWRVSYYLTGRKAQPAPWRVLIPRWEAPSAAPVLDLEVIAPTTTHAVGEGVVPVVTPDQLAAALAALPAGGTGTGGTVDLSGYATTTAVQTYVQGALDALVAGAPGALDTLDELAAALGDNPDAVATLTAMVAAKYTRPVGGIPESDLAAGVIPVVPPAPDLSPYLTTAAASAAYRQRSLPGYVATVPAFDVLPSLLPTWRKALARVLTGTGTAKFAVVGDSTAGGFGADVARSWPSVLRDTLDAHVPTADGLSIPPNLSPDPRWSWTTGWAFSGGVGMAGSALYGTADAGGTITFTPDGAYDTVDLYWYSGGTTHTATVTVAGTPTTVDLSQPGGGFVKGTTITRPLGTGPITITGPVGGEVYFQGIDAYDSTRPSVRVGNFGVSGASAESWANSYQSLGALQAYAPDLTIIALGVNDAGTPSPVEGWRTNMQTVITAAKASGDVILATCIPSADDAHLTLEKAYRAEMPDLAGDVGAPWLDLFGRIGSHDGAPADYYADTLHLTATGYADIATAYLNALTA